VIDGKEYSECDFCRASCPSRDVFKEPDSSLPLKCDMCEDDPPQEKPLCVQWCLNDALIYEEREEEVEEEVKMEDVEVGLESMVDKYGLQKGNGYCYQNSKERVKEISERAKKSLKNRCNHFLESL